MNSEQTITPTPDSGDQSLSLVGDPAFTLAAKKLAGSSKCLNCGTELKGPFCYFCGQPDRNFMRFFPALLRDLMEDLLDLDSRFMRTLKPLLFKPGRLTRDYMNGRRFRYTPPMRLYIFSSIVFFLLAALLSSNAIPVTGIGNAERSDQPSAVIAPQQKPAATLNDPAPTGSEQIDTERLPDTSSKADEDGPGFSLDDIQFNDEPWDRETNPVAIKWLPEWLNDRINDEIENSPRKAEQINKNPNLLIDKVFDILPATMFVLLPVVALIFKFWYLFAKRYYVEHLIFSLHNHSFLFIGLFLILLTNVTGNMLTEHDYLKTAKAVEWLEIAINIWIPLYLLISLRVVYQQNWFMSVGKFAVIGISYVALLSLVTTGVAVASFVLL